MKWLLWKDYRQNRLIVFVGLFILFAPYLMGVSGTCYAIYLGYYEVPSWQEVLVASSLYSLCLSQLTIALIGGNAIAGERVDRSAEFLASLPISRRKKLVSKLLLATAIIAVIWLLNAPICWCLAYANFRDLEQLAMILKITAIVGSVFFCVAWCLSAFLSSPTFAVVGGLLAPLLVACAFGLFGSPGDEMENQFWLFTIFIIIAIASFILGTWYYLRRVEP